VCLLRIEAHRGTFLITVRQNPDITTFSAEQTVPFSQVEPAITEVREFLNRLIAGGPTSEAQPHAAGPLAPDP
jgi:hypothetical protein